MAPSKVSTIDFGSFANVINGELRTSKQTTHAIDPATRKPNWEVPVASQQDVDEAVAAANTAFESWRKTTWAQRVQLLERFKEVYLSYEEELATLLKKEVGKPTVMATGEVRSGIDWFDWHINMKEPQLSRYEDESKIVEHQYVPLGVVAAICPWNFPLSLALFKILPAVQMGDTIIVKPSPFTPYSGLKLVEIANQVFPPGVVQALVGEDSLGPALVDHPDVAKISFTGSIATGKRIVAAAAKTMKRVTLELGGNDPCIVLPDVDIAKVAPQVAQGAFINTGQMCVCIKRIYIHSSIYRPFVEAMAAATKDLKVGSPYDAGVFMGPIQNAMQYERVKGLYEDVQTQGYKLAAGSTTIDDSSPGYFIQPAIVDNPPSDSRIVTEEPFGPIVPCQPYDDLAEAIKRANDTKTGLGASVFGTDVAKAREVAEQIESGTVWINSGPFGAVQAMFGGFKESGLGLEWGTDGILAYANVRAIHIAK